MGIRRKIKTDEKVKFCCMCLILIFICYICINHQDYNRIVETNGQIENTSQEHVMANGNLQIYFLNVGQADAALILHHEAAMLIDAGNVGDGEKIVEFIKDKNIDKLDIVIGTHIHEDHLGGMADVVSNIEICKILMPKNTSNSTKYYKNLLKSLKEKSIEITTVERDEVIHLDEDVFFEVLYVDNMEPDNINNASIVTELNFGTEKFLFMADAESEIEKILIKENKLEDVDVLKVGHHGSSTGTIQEFLDKIKPEVSVISVLEGGRYSNLPAKEVITRLENMNVVYRTDTHGTIFIESDGKNNKIEMYEEINLNGLNTGATLSCSFL